MVVVVVMVDEVKIQMRFNIGTDDENNLADEPFVSSALFPGFSGARRTQKAESKERERERER